MHTLADILIDQIFQVMPSEAGNRSLNSNTPGVYIIDLNGKVST